METKLISFVKFYTHKRSGEIQLNAIDRYLKIIDLGKKMLKDTHGSQKKCQLRSIYNQTPTSVSGTKDISIIIA